MIKVAILGATGFIGKKLAYNLLGDENEVRYLTRKDDYQILGAKAYIGDISSKANNLNQFLDKINFLINCAGEVDNQRLMRPTHVNGTANLLKILENSRLSLKQDLHWIQLSSCGAYGQNSENINIERYVDEMTPNNPVGEYEITKTEADDLIIDFANKHDWFKYTIIRPTNVFGHEMRSTAILRIARMIQKKLFFYIGHQDAIANFVHVDDVVSALVLATGNSKAYNQTFIVSNDCKFIDMVNCISDALKVKHPNWVMNASILRWLISCVGIFIKLPITNFHIDVMMRKTYYSNQKIKTVLEWNPSIDIETQFKQYITAKFKSQ